MFRVKFYWLFSPLFLWNCAKLQVEKIYLIILFFVVAAHRNIWKTFVCFLEINIPFGAIMELINKTQDKWIFLTELWKELFRTTFSNCTTNGKSLIFSYNPAQIFHSLDEKHTKKRFGYLGIRKHTEQRDFSIYRLNYDIFILRLHSMWNKKEFTEFLSLFLCFSGFSIFLFFPFIMKTSQAQQTAADLINQTIAQMSAGGEKLKKYPRKILQNLNFPSSKRNKWIENCRHKLPPIQKVWLK